MLRDNSKLRIELNSGLKLVEDPGVTFTGTDSHTGRTLTYVVFTDHRTTGSFLNKRRYVYYFKIDEQANRIILSDNDPKMEYDFVVETIAEALDCPAKGLGCLFELVPGGIKRVEII